LSKNDLLRVAAGTSRMRLPPARIRDVVLS
jgi:hypothetical protein